MSDISSAPPISLQIASSAPLPSGLISITAPLLPDQGVLATMSNFPPETYNLSLGSSVVKLMSSLTGPSGGGQLRLRGLINRLRESLSSTYFTDLDGGLGSVLGISRGLGEALAFNPYSTAAPSTGEASWVAMAQADASYRDRLYQVLLAIGTYGPSPLGLKLVAESFLLCPVELTESFQTVGTVQVPYVTITPHAPISIAQQYGLLSILNKVKPYNAVVTLAELSGPSPYTQVNLRYAQASSNYWEVQATSSSTELYGSSQVPQFAFGSSQGAAWSVNGSVSGTLSYANDILGNLIAPTDFEKIVWADGTYTNFLPQYALASASSSLLGNMAAPGNASANPLNPDQSSTSDILLSGVPLTTAASTKLVAQATPQFWSTPDRAYTDQTQDILEVRFSSPVNVNAMSFQLAHFPHTAYLQVYDDSLSTWVTYYTQTISSSVPGILPNPSDALANKTHPQHFGPGCWVPVSVRFAAASMSRVRLVLVRPGPNGPTGPYSALSNAPALYSLAVTQLSCDYVVDSEAALPQTGDIIGTSSDIAGNTITYSVYQEMASDLVGATGSNMSAILGWAVPGWAVPAAGSTPEPPANSVAQTSQWRCAPQPMSNAVVILYLDARDQRDDNPQVIDRFFIAPTHLGVACTLYFTTEQPPADGDLSGLNWVLVNRQYRLTTGWMTFPPVAATFFKFEMTNLVAEPLANPFPVTIQAMFFGNDAIAPVKAADGYQGALPSGTATQLALSAGQQALVVPTPGASLPTGSYSPAEALVATDPSLAQLLQSSFANYGYIDWQPFGASPVTVGGPSFYTVHEVSSINQIGFFCGFSSLQAYRTNPACPLDTPVYYEMFYDAPQIASANCVTAGGIYSGTGPATEILSTYAIVTSGAYVSASNVEKVQFATEQSPPYQLVPNDQFRNGRYLPPPQGDYAWNDQQDWNTVEMGDVTVTFNAQTLTPTLTRGATSINPSLTANGIVSGPFVTSPKGWAAFSVRLTINSVPGANPSFFSEYPLYLQLCQYNGSGVAPTVLQEWELGATTPGQTVEQYFPYELGSATGGNTNVFLCMAVAQHAGAVCPSGQTASWALQACSGFDPSIIWAFSSDGATWVDATGVDPIRNNVNGIVSLPSPSVNLYWQCTIYRPDMYVTSLKMRPWYSGSDLPRVAPVAAGPNISFSDPDQTIWSDPEFNSWALPVPIWWFAKYQQVPLFPDGVPVEVPSSAIYQVTVDEAVGPATDSSGVSFYMQMYHDIEAVGPAVDSVTANATYYYGVHENVGPATDSSTWVNEVPNDYIFLYDGETVQNWTAPMSGVALVKVAGGAGGGWYNISAGSGTVPPYGTPIEDQAAGALVVVPLFLTQGHNYGIYVGAEGGSGYEFYSSSGYNGQAGWVSGAGAGGWGYGLGGAGAFGSGTPGAGGGAGSALVDTSTSTLMAVAGGAGGASIYGTSLMPGGAGGTPNGAAGGSGGVGGQGGTQSAPGAGGTGGAGTVDGQAGSGSNGGAGVSGNSENSSGGGGGYYGGGSGGLGTNDSSGGKAGGGASSYAIENAGFSPTWETNTPVGNGFVELTYMKAASYAPTGSVQSFTVPSNLLAGSLLYFSVRGGAGGRDVYYSGGQEGRGVIVTGALSVNPGDQITIYVAQQGASQGGWGYGSGGTGMAGGGGGGGASALLVNGGVVVVAGGGGGEASDDTATSYAGGNGGILIGGNGMTSYGFNGQADGGGGGTTSGPGPGGAAAGWQVGPGSAGSGSNGGNGGIYSVTYGSYGGGGGGGGYYGGGGGGNAESSVQSNGTTWMGGGGGGGGSSYTEPSVLVPSFSVDSTAEAGAVTLYYITSS